MSKADLDQAQTAYDAAQADLSSLDAQVKEQEVQLEYYRVIAPSAGVVGDIPVLVGDRVTTTTPAHHHRREDVPRGLHQRAGAAARCCRSG